MKLEKALLPTCSKENKVNFIVYNIQQNTINFHLLAQDEFLSTRERVVKLEKALLPTCSKENKVNFIVYHIQQNTVNFHLLAQDESL